MYSCFKFLTFQVSDAKVKPSSLLFLFPKFRYCFITASSILYLHACINAVSGKLVASACIENCRRQLTTFCIYCPMGNGPCSIPSIKAWRRILGKQFNCVTDTRVLCGFALLMCFSFISWNQICQDSMPVFAGREGGRIINTAILASALLEYWHNEV